MLWKKELNGLLNFLQQALCSVTQNALIKQMIKVSTSYKPKNTLYQTNMLETCFTTNLLSSSLLKHKQISNPSSIDKLLFNSEGTFHKKPVQMTVVRTDLYPTGMFYNTSFKS